MAESKLGEGEIFGRIDPGFKRRFAIFQIAPNAIEARFDDGSRPVRVEVSQMARKDVADALKHALAGQVNLDCPRLGRDPASRASPSFETSNSSAGGQSISIRSAFAAGAFLP